jgi:hypothetical protein
VRSLSEQDEKKQFEEAEKISSKKFENMSVRYAMTMV